MIYWIHIEITDLSCDIHLWRRLAVFIPQNSNYSLNPPNILIGVGACIKRADSLKFSFSFCDKKLDAKSFICHKIYYLSGKKIIIPKLFSHNQKWLNTFKYLSTYLRRNSLTCIQNFLTNQYVSKAHLEVKNAHLLTIFSSIRR